MLGFNAISAAAIASLVTSGAIAGTASVTFSQTGDCLNQGSLSGSATLTFSQSGNLKGAGALSGPGTITFSGTATVIATFSLLGSTSFTITSAATAINANAGQIWQNPDGLFVLYGTAQGETKPAYASDNTPYREGKLRYDRPNPYKYRTLG